MRIRQDLRSFFDSDTEAAHLVLTAPIVAGAALIGFGLITTSIRDFPTMAYAWGGVGVIGAFMVFSRWVHGVGQPRRFWFVRRAPQPMPQPESVITHNPVPVPVKQVSLCDYGAHLFVDDVCDECGAPRPLRVAS